MKTTSKKVIITRMKMLLLGAVLTFNWGCQEEELEREPAQEIGIESLQPEFKAVLVTENEAENGRQTSRFKSLNEKFEKFEIYNLAISELSNGVNSRGQMNFVLNLGSKHRWTIKLEPSNIMSTDYQSFIVTEDGWVKGKKPRNTNYKGTTSDGGKVRLNMNGGKLNGFIETNGQEVYIQNLTDMGVAASANELIVYRPGDLLPSDNQSSLEAKTLVEKVDNYQVDTHKSDRNTAGKNSYSTLTISTVASYRRFDAYYNSVSYTNEVIRDIVNLSQEVYSEAGVHLLINHQIVIACEACMPPFVEGESNHYHRFRDWALASGVSSLSDIAFLFTYNSDEDGKATGSIVNGLCIGDGYNVAWSYDYTTWRMATRQFSRNIGRLLGSISPMNFWSITLTDEAIEIIGNNNCY